MRIWLLQPSIVIIIMPSFPSFPLISPLPSLRARVQEQKGASSIHPSMLLSSSIKRGIEERPRNTRVKILPTLLLCANPCACRGIYPHSSHRNRYRHHHRILIQRTFLLRVASSPKLCQPRNRGFHLRNKSAPFLTVRVRST